MITQHTPTRPRRSNSTSRNFVDLFSMETHGVNNSHNSVNISVRVSLKLLSQLVLHTIFHSTLLFKQIRHRSLRNFSSSTSRMSEKLDSSLPPVDFSFLIATAACIAYTAVVRLSSMCLPFPFASLDCRFYAPKLACGRAARRQWTMSQVPSLVCFPC